MADYSNMAMSQADISNLKDTLCAQQKLLQKLYNELDAEREASATAASEALNVILRLQGEKAAVKMEAEQYKRLAEEKMCHAEESFAIIEDIIYQKEMELASLDYQVQAYRYKLVSMGCVDPGGGEIKFPENLLVRSENLSPETGFCNNIGRRNSAPNMGRYKKGLIEKEGPTSPDISLSPKIVEREIYEKTENCYSDEIKRLNEKVKQIAGVNYLSSRSSPSISSRTSLTNLQNELRSPSPSLITNDQNKVPIENENENVLKKDVGNIDVLDVFEVPQADESLTKEKKLKSPCGDIVHDHEGVKMCAKEMPDWLKKLMQSNYREKRPIDFVACNNANNVSESHVNEASEIVEAEEVTNREEELKLLKEIKDQIISLQDEIRSQNVMKSSMKKEISYSPLPEAMLHFWL